MPYTQTLTDTEVFTALRAFLLDALGGMVTQVIRTPVNRVPEPLETFVLMTPITKSEVSWPTFSVSDPAVQPQVGTTMAATDFGIQLDFIGPAAGDAAQIIYTAFQSNLAFDSFAGQTPAYCLPLYAEAPHQAPMVDGEAEYEVRWVMPIHLQYNPALTYDVQTAATIEASIFNVEAAYP